MPDGKPNILVIWGDDIGISNLSCYSDGLMGYRTPNIDRIAAEGMRFTDSYGEQSCTAGRAAFISGQSVFRTGMSKVGVPGARSVGRRGSRRSPSCSRSAMRRPIRQNHQRHRQASADGSRLDEFFGNLYHLNAEEEPEQFDYPHKDQFRGSRTGASPRGAEVKATRGLDRTDDPKFGPVGKQVIEDTGR